jgi:electron transport complex protein RnfB
MAQSAAWRSTDPSIVSLPTPPPANLEVGTDRRHAEAIHALLPQTQCTRCGFQGCRPYADAIAAGEAEINRCPPGGLDTLVRLAALTGRAVQPLDPGCGREGPEQVAHIDEERCIGCARCLPPCPVDAIVGAQRRLHTVLVDLCTGCELCIAPCPVDCITLRPRTEARPTAPAPSPADNLQRYDAHLVRRGHREQARLERLAERKARADGRMALPDLRGDTP